MSGREEKNVSCLLADSALSTATLSPTLAGREGGGEEVGVTNKSEVEWERKGLESVPESVGVAIPPADWR